MTNRIIPAPVDNRYRGHALGLWLFVPIGLQKLAESFVHILTADGGAQSIDTMPLDTYPHGASQTIIGLMAHIGVEQLVLVAFFVVVLVRYRSLIPLLYILLVGHDVIARAVTNMKPLVFAGTPGASLPHLVITILSVIGLTFSLIGRGYAEREPAPTVAAG